LVKARETLRVVIEDPGPWLPDVARAAIAAIDAILKE
jgi:hypothetical protein